MEFPTKLAEFKRWLAQPGVGIRGLYHWRGEALKEPYRSSFYGVRRIKAVQSNGYWTEQGGFCDFGKAADWVFDGSKVTNLLGDGQPCFTIELVA